MPISARCILKSSFSGMFKIPDLYTVVARYPRIIHAEAKTHRIISMSDAEYEFMQEISVMDDPNLSRNASSSRAVPIQRLIDEALNDPAFPVEFGSHQPGMQAAAPTGKLVGCYQTPADGVLDYNEVPPEDAWLTARDWAVSVAKGFMEAGYAKQVVNRLLEPFTHITVLISSTEWDNFFKLRRHPDADPTMRALADAIWDAMQEPEESLEMPEYGWHLPFIAKEERGCFATGREAAMVSAARCARVSYLRHDGSKPRLSDDIALSERLLSSGHMSPFEHQGRVPAHDDMGNHLKCGNFVGWHQFRKMVEPEPSRRY